LHLILWNAVQVSKDFVPTLQTMPNTARKFLLNLVSDDGVLLGDLYGDLATLLNPFLTKTMNAQGMCVVQLDAPWHASLIRVNALLPTTTAESVLGCLQLLCCLRWLPSVTTKAFDRFGHQDWWCAGAHQGGRRTQGV
jgi:hypothetical protein